MSSNVITVIHPEKVFHETARQREELVQRVASSVTFEKSPRLRAFFRHVCRCALENKSEEATEQQIGIYVYGRQPGYNPNDDNIVRSQARVLRMKLEHHFANDGIDEPIVITIPKGQYLPIFEPRTKEPDPQPRIVAPPERKPNKLKYLPIVSLAILALALAFLGYIWLHSKRTVEQPISASQPLDSAASQADAAAQPASRPLASLPGINEILISAGHTGNRYDDIWGRRWESDRYYQGGAAKAGPNHLFPPVADPGIFKSIREALSDDSMVPQSERQFNYDIPVSPGTYELRLYFADPLRQPDSDQKEDGQNIRHFDVDLNGHPLLVNFDPITDAGSSAVDIRTFKDVSPAADGKVHLEFRSLWGKAFVNAIELAPGTPGKLQPIRISARRSDFIDASGIRWSGDKFFINGRTLLFGSSRSQMGPKFSDLYSGERFGNFSYSIPVAPGSYTVRLHFLESFFSPVIPAASCHGVGCRVFNVTCNGVALLQSFDISKAAPGAFQPVVREFHGLHPNGQGKLLLSFAPETNYAEVRAIEVIDEAR
jgi:hypothetical protein